MAGDPAADFALSYRCETAARLLVRQAKESLLVGASVDGQKGAKCEYRRRYAAFVAAEGIPSHCDHCCVIAV